MKENFKCELTLTCQQCGQDVKLQVWDGGVTLVFHEGCDAPTVTMVTHNPRKLGVITGVTE